ncbi:MAG TPA: DUF3465 domain-containing protein [Candidatus Baltobacteraceae bacterium]|nr:DUF3465 domain-containing protein [Candidatus Baltobacteraceae bacterium]
MKRAIALALLLSGCAGSSSYVALDRMQSACANGASHGEITLSGQVVRVLGARRSRSGEHEGFVFRTPSCSPERRPCPPSDVKVEVNEDITGPMQVAEGDAVTVRGQYECNDGVVHWTHRDPRGRHVDGFVDVNGVRYQ